MPRWGVMTVNSPLHHDQAWICCLPSKPSSSVTPYPSECVYRVSAQEMFYISLHELILSARSPRRSISVEFLSAVIMLDEDPESKDVKINMMQ